jgi:uncharacterized membrane protein required for colicin V production
METLSLVIDAILILILVATILDGRRKGFFKTVLSLVATAVSVLVAYEYSSVLAEWANEVFIQKVAVNTLADSISSHLNSGTQAVIEAIPDFAVKAAEASGVSISSLISHVGSSVDSVEAAGQIYSGIYSIVIFPVLSVLAFIVLFAITNAVLSLGIKLINNIFRLPVLKSLNKTLGGVLGAVKGIVIIGILGVVLVMVSPILPEEFSVATDSSIIPNIFADLFIK